MRNIIRVLVAATSLLAALTVAHTTDVSATALAEGTARQDSAYVSRLMFETPMGTFITITSKKTGPSGSTGDAWFDWSTDTCSAPLVGNTGRTFNFTESCRRHDFGYRNSQLLDRRYGKGRYWNHDARKRIDQQFLDDMKNHCHGRRLIDRPTCYSWAYTFYSAVRVAGGP